MKSIYLNYNLDYPKIVTLFSNDVEEEKAFGHITGIYLRESNFSINNFPVWHDSIANAILFYGGKFLCKQDKFLFRCLDEESWKIQVLNDNSFNLQSGSRGIHDMLSSDWKLFTSRKLIDTNLILKGRIFIQNQSSNLS